MIKVGRNDPCPCGSGKKYKKCCLQKQIPPPSEEDIKQVIEVFQKHEAEKRFLEEKGIFINYVNPCTYTDPKTKQRVKIWALGSRLFYNRPEHETFHEFIIDHLLKMVLGKEWFDKQVEAEEKHFLYQCFIKWDEWRKKNSVEENKVDNYTWSACTDGWTKTLYSLAFDVCSLEHTSQLPDYLLKRLKNRGEYQGAHYEIAIAAIFSRLGCRIDFLDKQKITTPHCEFIATHNETGVSIAVEAKSRQRPGVKHRVGILNQEKILRGDVQNLLNKALKQNPKNNPFIIFIDLNAPLTPNLPIGQKPWFNDIKNMLKTYPAPTKEKPEEYTALFVTNFSPHYNAEEKSMPNEHLAIIPVHANYPMPNQVFEKMLLNAVKNYGFVPDITEIDKYEPL